MRGLSFFGQHLKDVTGIATLHYWEPSIITSTILPESLKKLLELYPKAREFLEVHPAKSLFLKGSLGHISLKVAHAAHGNAYLSVWPGPEIEDSLKPAKCVLSLENDRAAMGYSETTSKSLIISEDEARKLIESILTFRSRSEAEEDAYGLEFWTLYANCAYHVHEALRAAELTPKITTITPLTPKEVYNVGLNRVEVAIQRKMAENTYAQLLR